PPTPSPAGPCTAKAAPSGRSANATTKSKPTSTPSKRTSPGQTRRWKGPLEDTSGSEAREREGLMGKLAAGIAAAFVLLLGVPLMGTALMVTGSTATALQLETCTAGGAPVAGTWRPPYEQAYVV